MLNMGMKHTYEECYEVAKKYEYQDDFIKNDPAIFYAAYRRGWLKDYDWIKKKRHSNVTMEECVNAALECESAGEFKERFPREYRYAWRNKILDDFDWMRHSKWNYDTVAEESRKYKTRNEFYKSNSSAYSTALKYGWLDSFTWLDKVRGLDKVDKLGKVYNIYGIFDNENMKCYIYASRYKNYDSILKRKKLLYNHFAGIGKEIPEPITLDSYLTASEAVERRKQFICMYKNQGYVVLFDKNVWLGSFEKDKPDDDTRRDGVKWTYDEVYNIAKKYEYLVDFTNQDHVAFRAAKYHDWLKDFTWLKRVRNMKGYRSKYKTEKLINGPGIDAVDFRDGAFFVDGDVLYGMKI